MTLSSQAGGMPGEQMKRYVGPSIRDLGAIAEVTQSHLVVMGGQAMRFGASFASSVVGPGPVPPPGPTDTGVPLDTIVSAGPPTGGGGGGGGSALAGHPHGNATQDAVGSGGTTGAEGTAGSGSSGGHGSSSGGQSGGSLPFTGYAVALSAGLGLTLASTGRVLRRALRR